MKYEFPKDFLWGVATASAQVEGAAFEDGKGATIWDVFCRLPGTIRDGNLMDVTCDQYHLYEKDIKLMKDMGVRSYRFSFSWARILPDGTGKINEKGLDYYRRLIRCLKDNGIVPNATMYHWDLPYALQLKGGWGNRDIVEWFKEYAAVLLDNFGKDVDIWVTFNEPIATYVGYGVGSFAPGLADEKYARQALHNLLVAHGEVVKLFREKNLPNAKIGIVVDIWRHYASRPGNAGDEALVLKGNEIAGYGWFLHALFLGGYSEALTKYMEEKGFTPRTEEGDFETISQKIDFYGLNFYNGIIDNVEKMREIEQKQAAGGNYQSRPEQHPEAIYDILHMLVEKYHVNVPIYVTENGYIHIDEGDKPAEYFLDDPDRIEYIRDVLQWIRRAMDDGIDVRGYYCWSLLDNFEWNAGFTMRYGLNYTDFRTLERIPKKSAGWYSQVIADNGFDAEPIELKDSVIVNEV